MQLFQENEENSHNKTEKCRKMIPLKTLTFEHYCHKHSKHSKRNDFLDDFQLHEIEWASVFYESDSVGWYLGTIFKESNSPREEYYYNERPPG